MGGQQVRIACAAWLATLATASALVPLVAGTGWLVQAGLLLAAQTATGILVRLRSAVLAVPAQVVMSLVALTAVTVPADAVAGLVPGPQAFAQFGRLLGAGVDDIGHHVVPAPVTEGIALLLFGGVLLVGLLVDLTAVTLGSAASAGLPLLALYSVAAGVTQSGASWPYFLCAAAGYLLLLLTEGRERVIRWGRFFPGAGDGDARAGLPQHSLASPRARTGRRIGAVTLGAAMVVPLLLPSLDDGLLNLDDGAGPSGVDRIAVDNSAVSLRNKLNQPEDRPVLHYTTTSDRPEDLYLRVAALDEFDGEKWRSSAVTTPQAPGVPWPATGLSKDWEGRTASTTIKATDTYTQTSLPAPYPATSIVTPPRGSWLYDGTTQTMAAEDPGLSTQEQRWTVEHRLVDPTGDELDDAPRPPREIRDLYTEVPGGLPSVVRETAATVTADATNDHERAVLLQQYFTGGRFEYNKNVASGNGVDAIATFLEQKKGFCVHFAFTMAAMARTLDIPAQVVVGFAPGTLQEDGKTYEVSIHDAHAWPELYFEGAGWVRFEPTPGVGSTPAYTEPLQATPDTPRERRGDVPQENEPPAPTPDSPSSCDALVSGGSCPELSLDGDSAGGTLLSWPLLAGGAGGLLVAAVAAAPGLWRRRARFRRLAAGGRPLSAWRELIDTAWDYGIVPVRSETPRQAAGRIVRVGQLPVETVATVHRVVAAVEEELYAPPAARRDGPLPGPRGTGLSREVREVARALGVAAGRSARVRAALLPRSAVRVREAAAQRAAAAARRVREALVRAAARLHRA